MLKYIKSILLTVSFLLAQQLQAQQFEPATMIIGKTADGNVFAHADLDGDGDEDIIVGGLGRLRWIENDGSGGYFKYHAIAQDNLDRFPTEIEVGDVNGDGHIDFLLISSNTSELLLYLNDGSGAFSEGIEITSSSNFQNLKLADLDGDADLDLTVSLDNPLNDIRIFENDGSGSFSQVLQLNNVGLGLENIALGDIGGSALPDLVICSIGDDRLVWHENTGGFSFGEQILISTDHDTPVKLAISDLNGDGLNDIVCSSQSDEELAWFQNTGAGGFSSQNIITVANNLPRFIAADIDNDNDIDLLADSEGDNFLEFFENDGAGNFSSPVLLSDFRAFPWIAAFDADNDGDIDPVYSTFGQPFRGGLRIIPNDDNNGFLPEEFLTFGLNDCEAIDHADLDGDGWQDVLSISSRDSTVYLSKNLGNGTFDVPVVLSDSVNLVQSVLAVDIDNDGDMDVLAVERGIDSWPNTNNNRVHVYENDGTGSFSLGTMLEGPFPGGSPAYSFVFAEDVTGNSFADVFVLSYEVNGLERIYKWENNGNWSFSPRIEVGLVSSVQSLEFADLDGVQGLDMVYTSGSWSQGPVSIRLNDGTGNFPDEIEVSMSNLGLGSLDVGESLVPGDMDGDGDIDIVASLMFDLTYNGYQGSLQLLCLLNDGNANFDDYVMIQNTYGLCQDLEVGDLDGDNDLDVVGLDIHGTSWWRNDGDGNYTRFAVDSISDGEIINGEIISNRSLKLVDLDNDGDLDVLHSDLVESYKKRQLKWSRNTAVNCGVLPSLTASGEPEICAGSSITLTASGGVSFSWNNDLPNQAQHTVTPEETTTYQVTVDDGEGCSLTASLTVTVLPNPEETIEVSDCESYTAPDGAIYTESGQYTAVVSNEYGCDTTFTINLTIEDLEAPVADLAMLDDISSECEVNELTAPTASDNCEGTVTGTHDAVFPISASTTIVWTYMDGNGNTSTQSQEVIIADTTAPEADVPVLDEVNAECEVNTLSAPTATDNCSGAIAGTHNATFPITESTTLTWTYDDGNGNTSTQTQEVIIADTTAPEADAPTLESITAECELNTLSAPTATDNCSGAITGTHNATFPITESTTLTWTYDDGNGNSSTQTQEIVITPIDDGIGLIDEFTLIADASDYSYQWIDCENGNTPILGETAQSFDATMNGQYAVEISNGTCSVLSECIEVIVFSVNDSHANAWFIYPNPVRQTVYIGGDKTVISVRVVNTLGQEIRIEFQPGQRFFILPSDISRGQYYVHLSSLDHTSIMRMMVD